MADWKSELEDIISSKAKASRAQQENAVFEEFLDAVALPALKQIAEELRATHGRETAVRRAPASVTLNVRYGNDDEINFQVMKHFVQSGILPRAEVRLNRAQKMIKYAGMFRDDPQNYPISEVTRDDIIRSFLKYYRMTMDKNLRSTAD
ncbi:MAG: hypothetical protein R6V06_01440 [Kiritimatiellia bacterium]